MKNLEKFPTLSGFFSAWYPDADLEGLDDREVVKAYLKTVSDQERSNSILECEQLLLMSPLPLKEIADQAWRLFPNEAECRAWLEIVLSELKNR